MLLEEVKNKMTNPKITSINIKTDGKPVAIVRIDEHGNPEYRRIGLIALPINGEPKTYQINCYGVKPFSLRGLENGNQGELETAVNELVGSCRPARKFDSVKNGRALRVFFNREYSGLLSIGRRYDERTIWDAERREIIEGELLGNFALKRYSPDVRVDFQELSKYLEERNKKANQANCKK